LSVSKASDSYMAGLTGFQLSNFGTKEVRAFIF